MKVRRRNNIQYLPACDPAPTPDAQQRPILHETIAVLLSAIHVTQTAVVATIYCAFYLHVVQLRAHILANLSFLRSPT